MGKNVGEETEVVAAPTNSDSACVEIKRPERVHKSPERYTPSEVVIKEKKRKIKRMVRFSERVKSERNGQRYGPFTKDPKQMPSEEDVEKVRVFLNEGLLKRRGIATGTCRYVAEVDDLSKDPIVLDGFKVENKTWFYELFTNTEWLRSTHIEIAMYYLELKSIQYSLMQTYTAASPYFLQGLKTHQEVVDVGKVKMEDVIDNSSLSSEVLGLAREYAKPWCECDFVYMPLNTGNHWMLLVLEVEERKIRVYNSKGKKGQTSRGIIPYVTCISSLLPKLLDMLNVYKNHSDGPMGDQKLSIDIIDGCPQQSDGCNCGMFVVKFAEFLMMDLKIDEVQSCDMEAYQVKMTTELLAYSYERKEESRKQ
ncbi:unnamed protein product [Cuscuta campestris]|uniref:Ubiquitin-like protease family profile domain-containing protein n=1 Tax=Cuscuta campestris TaxID=132261 RepID=A0A484L189_9ASTE|nr:unnamed protein product [Cuscuta campestris]